jgi:hypothetical protein
METIRMGTKVNFNLSLAKTMIPPMNRKQIKNLGLTGKGRISRFLMKQPAGIVAI